MSATITTSPETMVHRPRLHGRVAFVTGGTRGTGGAICNSLAEQGADVAAGYSRDREAAERCPGGPRDRARQAGPDRRFRQDVEDADERLCSR